jgi:hypothetical protein
MQRLATLALTALLFSATAGLTACSRSHAPGAGDEPGTDNDRNDGGAADSGSTSGSGALGAGTGGAGGDGTGGAGGDGTGAGVVGGSSAAAGCSSSATCTLPEVCDLRSQMCAAQAVLTVEITPTNPTIARSTAQHFTATATYNDGTTADVTTAVTWTSSDVGVATLDASGLATTVSAGQSTISAALDGTTGSTLLTVSDATLASLTVTPTNPAIAIGTKQAFTATGNFSDGSTQDVTAQATWSSSATNVASIDASGIATGGTAGSTTIAATLSGISGTTSLTVSSAQVASIVIQPADATLAKGTSQQFTAQALFDNGTSQDVTAQVTWASSDPTLATISNMPPASQGLTTASGEGSTTISATLNGVSGSTTLIVSAATLISIAVDPALPTVASGLSQQFTATGTFSDTSTQDLTTQVTWASSDSAVATVSNAMGSEGLAQTITAGSTLVSATLGSVEGSSSLTVSNAAVVSITIDPVNPSIAAGTQQQFTATGVFTDGTSLDVTTQVVWNSSATDVAVISNAGGSHGLAQSVAAGSTTISASMNSVSGTSTLAVTSATLQSISLEPLNSAIAQGTTQQFIATGGFSDGSTANVTTQVAWSSSNLTVASISNASGSEGLASSIGVGATTIGASFLGVTGQTQLTVNASSLVSISLSPVNPSIAVSTQQQFTAIGMFDNGTTQDITSLVSWASSNMQVASVSNVPASTGLATGLRAGQSTISANFQGKTGQSTLTVAAVMLQSITIAPSNASIGRRTKQQFTATGTFADGSMRDVTKQVTWSSSTQRVAVISNASASRGLATGLARGVTTIAATLNGVSASTTLTVSAATLTSIAVSPATASIARQQTQQFTAVGTFSDSSTQDLTAQVMWSSSKPSVAAISRMPGSRGRATGVAPGSATITARWAMSSGSATLVVTQ